MNRDKILLGFRKSGLPIFLAQGAADEDPLERLRKREGELVDLMEATIKDTKEESRTADQRKSDLETFDKYETELTENREQQKALQAGIDEVRAREERVLAARQSFGTVQIKPGNPSERDAYKDIDYSYRGVEADGRGDARGSQVVWIERAKRHLDESNDATSHLRSDQREKLLKLVRQQNEDLDGELIAAFMLATSHPDYRSAFQKATSGIAPVFSPEEARAVRQVNSLKRAMSIGTPAAGGYAVPVIIDPTIILTAQGTDNPILRRARVETITVDTWKGLSSAGVTWKFGAEASASTDNSPTIAQPTVDTNRADGFIPFSIEVGMDWPGFAERMSELLGSGYDELLADKLTNGTGADTPVGILSRLAAQTSPVVKTPVTTAGTFAPTDFYDMWARLPQRHRRRGTTAWMSSTDAQNAVRQLGTLDPNFTVNMTEEGIGRLFGREYDMNDYFADLTSGTGSQNLAVVGNWQGFLVAQRAGMNIEFVPMLFDVTNNRPTGQRGWFAWARVGSDVVDPTAFQLLTNKTT